MSSNGVFAAPRGTALHTSKSNGSMQLLDYKPINFSLTAGTDIPAPPPSPPPKKVAVESKPLPTLAAAKSSPPLSPSADETTLPSRHAASEATLSPSASPRANSGRRLSKFLSLKSLNTAYDDPAATSPTPTSFTPNLLTAPSIVSPSSAHQNSSNPDGNPWDRKRPSTPSVAPSNMTATKRVRSWFRRKSKITDVAPGSYDAGQARPNYADHDGVPGPDYSNPYSTGLSPDAAAREQRGPPPPRIPDLNTLSGKGDKNGLGGLGGGEMFRNIK